MRVVRTGPYRYSRNPDYVGQVLAYLGATLVANTWWPMFLAPVVIVAIQRGVVRREERYLEGKFGREYRDYSDRVPQMVVAPANPMIPRTIQEVTMPQVRVSAGPIDYCDTGGDKPVVVFLHGVLMDGHLFDFVVDALRTEYRCIVPTLPLGAHLYAMDPDADLSLRGFGRMVGEFLECLDLCDVTVVQNDHAAAIALASDRPARVARLVLSSCEAFENYPPGLPGRNLALLARIPGGLYLAMQLMRIRRLRRLPVSFGWMTKRPIPDRLTDAWFRPAQTQTAVRRDLIKYAAGARRRHMQELVEKLRGFDRPTLIIWATEDRVMPPSHGRRLAELLPNAQLVNVRDSYTLIPLDQPVLFASLLREFIATNLLHREH